MAEKIYDIQNLRVNRESISFKLSGETITVPLTKSGSTILPHAQLEHLQIFEVDDDGIGIHWPVLDEDLSVAGLLRSAGKEDIIVQEIPSSDDASCPPMGQLFRLRADFDISGFSPEVQVILRALKRYGMMVADDGGAWYISGTPDERWNNNELHALEQVHGSDFEAVDVSSLMVSPDSGQAR